VGEAGVRTCVLRRIAYIRSDKVGIQEDMQRVFTLFPGLKERETQLDVQRAYLGM
jgi:hypothetical protein